ncbi:unnamed protein product, partial [Prorocentrum cordatum]
PYIHKEVRVPFVTEHDVGAMTLQSAIGSLCLLWLPAAALVVKDGEDKSAAVPRIDTYVINMDKRPDRCRCMQSQLLGAPQPVYRQRAVGADSCPLVTKMHGLEKLHGKKKRYAEQSLFCNNYQIWEKASKSDADFVVILEDDALLLPGFWPKLYEFVQGCESFDYAIANPVTFNPKTKKYSSDFWNKNGEPAKGCSASAYQPIKKGLAHWHTTTMTVIRKTFLPTLIEKAHAEGWGATDDWWQVVLTPEFNAYGWDANVTVQASVGEKSKISSALSGAGCGADVGSSDIGVGLVSAFKRSGPQPARLECPA